MKKNSSAQKKQRFKKNQPLPSATGKGPNSKETTKPRTRPQGWLLEGTVNFLKGAKEVWFWASFPSVAMSAWFNLVPNLSISTSVNADNSSSFGTLISITNSGHVSVSDAQLVCTINSPGFMKNVSIVKNLATDLSAGHSTVSDCGINSPGYQSSASIGVTVRYKWAWGLFNGKKEVLFVTQKDVHGQSFMVPR